MRDRRRVHASSNQSGKVRHIDHIKGADFIGDGTHPGEVDDAGIGAAAADDQLGMLALSDLLELIVIDGFRILGDTVRDDAIGLARKIKGMAMSEVTAMRKV
jgi:hypothetical protein